MLLDLTDYKSILVQVMAWCHQASSHYLSQCWPTRPQWVNSSSCGPSVCHFNTLKPPQKGCYFADIFKCIFFNENAWISIPISLKFVPLEAKCQQVNIGLSNCLVQNMQHKPITCTIGDKDLWSHVTPPHHHGLTHLGPDKMSIS